MSIMGRQARMAFALFVGGRKDDLSTRVWLLLSQEINSWWMLGALRASYISNFLVPY